MPPATLFCSVVSPNVARRHGHNLTAVVKPIMSTQLEALDQMRRRGGRLEGGGDGVQPTPHRYRAGNMYLNNFEL